MAGLNSAIGQAQQIVGQEAQFADQAKQQRAAIDKQLDAKADDFHSQLQGYEQDFKDLKGKVDESTKPFQAPGQKNPIEAFGSIAGILVTLASMGTKTPFTTSLNSMAAGMKAIREGNNDAYEKAFKEWQTNTDFALKRLDWENSLIKEDMELAKTDYDTAIARLQTKFSAFPDPAAQFALRIGGLQTLGQLQEARERLGLEAQAQRAKMVPFDLYHEWGQEYQKQNGHKPSVQENAQAWGQIAAGMAPPEFGKQASVGGAGGQAQAPANSNKPETHDILTAAGLSEPAFLALTGQSSQLPRDKVTRGMAFAEAKVWAKNHDVDISTFPAQYKALSSVVEKNIQRNAQTKVMEAEMDGTIQNLKPIAAAAASGNLRVGDVANLFAGKEVNDPTVMQYSFFLNQLRDELAGYNAAIQGRMGGSQQTGVRVADYEQAERTIENGLNSKALDGLQDAVSASTSKMSKVMENTLNSAHQQVWDMFGVGDKFSPSDTGFHPQLGWPSAKGQKDGRELHDEGGHIIARVHNGQWIAP